MSLEQGIRQHKGMAMGKGVETGSTFGCLQLHSLNGGPKKHPDADINSGQTLPESRRAIGSHVERGAGHLPAQRNPDHGPHFHRND